MATSSYPVNHAMAVKLWSKKLFYEVIKESWFSKFAGTGSDSMIQIKGETQKGKGDRIRVGLRMLLTGDGVQGDNTQEGNEEALTIYNDDVLINQTRHATRSGGKMSEQRVPFEVREENREALKDWWAERLEVSLANQLTGNTAQANTLYTGNNAAVACDANHIMGAGAVGMTETSITATTTNCLNLIDIDRCVARAKTISPKIRPIRVGGKSYYVMFLHPYQVYQLRAAASAAGTWYDITKAALQGAQPEGRSGIFDGALGVYNNVVLHEWSYLPTAISVSGTANQFRRAVFCGAQAAILGYGQDNGPDKMTWVEELFDGLKGLSRLVKELASEKCVNSVKLSFA